jgi:predicted esterase
MLLRSILITSIAFVGCQPARTAPAPQDHRYGGSDQTQKQSGDNPDFNKDQWTNPENPDGQNNDRRIQGDGNYDYSNGNGTDGQGDGGGDSTPPPSNNTNGTGGQTGSGEGKSNGGLSFLYDVPSDNAANSKAHGLLVLLHGSSASNYTRMVGMMQQVANLHGLIRVSVLAPNGRGWNEGGESNAADSLHALVQDEFFAKYNVDKSKIFFSGQSSGAGFLASHFVAMHAKDYTGGAFMQCGANAPRVQFAPDEATKKNFKLHFEITTGDSIWPQAYVQGTQAYSQAGMNVTKDNTKSGGHCQFDQQAIIQSYIVGMMQ